MKREEELVPISVVLVHTDSLWAELQRLGEELNDDLALWEPVPGCWSIRQQPDGSWRNDWTPDPAVPPFTTIAWRIAHVGQSLAAHARRLFGQGSFEYESYQPTGELAGAMSFVTEAFSLWRAGIQASGESLSESLATEVLSLNTHHFQHVAEILTLRDLHRAGHPLDPEPFVDACLRGDAGLMASHVEADPSSVAALVIEHADLVTKVARQGHWALIPTLLELGFSADPPSGATALHYAAVAGPLSCIELLVQNGSDLDRRDPQYNETPKGWAEYFGRPSAVEFLETAIPH